MDGCDAHPTASGRVDVSGGSRMFLRMSFIDEHLGDGDNLSLERTSDHEFGRLGWLEHREATGPGQSSNFMTPTRLSGGRDADELHAD